MSTQRERHGAGAGAGADSECEWAARPVGEGFSVRVSLERFFADERARVVVWAERARPAGWLLRRLRAAVPALPPAARLALLAGDCLLPLAEPLAVLRPADADRLQVILSPGEGGLTAPVKETKREGEGEKEREGEGEEEEEEERSGGESELEAVKRRALRLLDAVAAGAGACGGRRRRRVRRRPAAPAWRPAAGGVLRAAPPPPHARAARLVAAAQ